MAENNDALRRIKTLFDTPDLPELGPEARPGREPLDKLEPRLDQVLNEASLAKSLQPLIRSAVLLWHDHLEASHAISQGIHSPDGSFLHGIMHRREPDYGNSKYWFHRAGKPACYPLLARKVEALFDAGAPQQLLGKLVPGGEWDPVAFVDACEEAGRGNQPEELKEQLKKVQSLEFEALLETVAS